MIKRIKVIVAIHSQLTIKLNLNENRLKFILGWKEEKEHEGEHGDKSEKGEKGSSSHGKKWSHKKEH